MVGSESLLTGSKNVAALPFLQRLRRVALPIGCAGRRSPSALGSLRAWQVAHANELPSDRGISYTAWPDTC